jgi:hypothetical protein
MLPMLAVFLSQQYCCTLLTVLLYNAFGSTRQEYNRNLVLIILINYCFYFMKCLPYQKYCDNFLTIVIRCVFLLCKTHFCYFFYKCKVIIFELCIK